MRRFTFAAVMLAAASVASAQMPPSISKPIDAAKKAAGAANANAAEINQQARQVTAPASKPAPAPQAKAAPVKAMPAPAKAAPAPAAKNTPAPQAKSAAPAPALQLGKGGKPDSNLVTFEREVFTFAPREFDPFASPIETGEIRPLVADLRVVGIIFDATGRNSVAVLRDMSTQQQYRVKVGQKLGRTRVAQIRTQEVVLTIEEYGFSRPETLKLNTTQQTQQTKGKP